MSEADRCSCFQTHSILCCPVTGLSATPRCLWHATAAAWPQTPGGQTLSPGSSVFQSGLLCPHFQALPSILAVFSLGCGRLPVRQSFSLPFPLPPSASYSVWPPWVWPRGPAKVGHSSVPEAPGVTSQEAVAPGWGGSVVECSGSLAHPLPRREEEERNRNGGWQKNGAEREVVTQGG